MSLSRLQKNKDLADQHQQLLRDQEHYACLINKHKKHLISLEEKMKKIQDTIVDRKRQMGGHVHMLRRAQQENKNIQVLEDRVSQSTMRYDKLLSQNQEIRSDIDHLCRERVKLMTEYQRINKKLKKQKSIMDSLVDASVPVYDQRSDILKQMLEVQDSSRVDTALFHAKINELKHIMHHESKLHTFMEQKSKERLSVKERDEAKKKKTEDARTEQDGNIEMYYSVHDHIVASAGESDISKISRTFVENEENNFGVFNYITELNNQSAWLQERMVKLKKGIEQFELQSLHHDTKCKMELKDLQDELERTSCRADILESQYAQVCETLHQKKNVITALFTQINSDLTSITEQLRTAEVTEENIFCLIAVLEERIQELLMQMVQDEDGALPIGHRRRSTMLPAATELPVAASFQYTTTNAVLGTGYLKPLDYRTLYELVLPHVVMTRSRTTHVPTTIPKPKKKPVYHFKSN